MLSKKTNTNLFKGAAALSLASVLVKVIGVIYKIPLAGILGDEGMSYFNSAYTVYAFFFILCSAGVPKALTILISGTSAENRGEEKSILVTSSVFFFLAGVIFSVVFILSAPFISDFIGSRKIAYSMIAIAPAIPFIAAASVLRGYLNGKLRFTEIAVSQCIEAVLKLVLGLVFAGIASRKGHENEMISAYAIAGITVGSLVTFLHLFARVKILNIDNILKQKAKISKKHLKSICSISLPITASSTLMSFVNIIDLAIIMRGLQGLGYSEYVSSVMYGNYTTLAVPMFNFPLSLTTSICASALPILSESAANRNIEELKNHLHSACGLVAFFASPAAIIFLFFSREVLTVLFESGSVTLGAFFLTILSVSVPLISILTVLNTALESIGCYNTVLISMIVGSGIKLLSSYILVGHTELALWGAPIGTALSYAVSLTITLAVCKFKLGRRVTTGFASSGVIALIAAVAIILIKRLCGLFVATRPLAFGLLAFYGIIYLLLYAIAHTFSNKGTKFIAK